ncbi:MAG: hypothetical protein LLG16_02685 [Euryarchaeota archaeon]|nr:hypothetical protein [Euryarchaeota archaeon]
MEDAVVKSDGVRIGGFLAARYQKVEEIPGSKEKNKKETSKIEHTLVFFVHLESARYFIDRMDPDQHQPQTLDLSITGTDKHGKQRTIAGKFKIVKMDGKSPATVDLSGVKGIKID